MANSTLIIPELNPVKFYSETLKYPENYLSRWMDDFSFQNQIRDFEAKPVYLQKWMKQDVIHLFLETDFADLQIDLIGEDDILYRTITPSMVLSAINPYPNEFRIGSITLTDLPTGNYFLRIRVTVSGAVKNYDSEPFSVCTEVPNSVLYHYACTYNEYDVAFDTGIVFQFRAEGGLTEYRPGSKRKIYEDQNLNTVRLSATPFKNFKLIVGGPEGVPPWVPDKINRIFCCDYISIDGTEFVRNDCDMEPKREDYYPMAGWSFDIREAANRHSKQFNLFLLFGLLDYDGIALIDIDNQPILYS